MEDLRKGRLQCKVRPLGRPPSKEIGDDAVDECSLKDPEFTEVFPGDCIIASPLGQDCTFQALMRILHDGWAEVETADLMKFRLKATIFHHHFVPLKVQMCVYCDAKAAAESCSSIIVLRDLGRTDVVRFHEIAKTITDSLGWFELKADHGRPCSPVTFRSESLSTTDLDPDEDFFDDDFDDVAPPDGQAAHTSTMAMLFSDALGSSDSSMRTAACQALARWARSAPGCHAALVEAAAEHRIALRRALGYDSSAPAALEEAFPLAAAIHIASRSANAGVLLSQCEFLAPDATQRDRTQPRLVHKELVKAFATAAAWASESE